MYARFRSALLVLALATAPAAAQDATIGFNPRTGDVWVDTWLGDVNRYGRTYREPFIDELVRYHGAPRDLVVELLRRPGWTPGDVYFACSLAAAVGRPCRYVADEYERDRGAGWGALAQRLGVQPGSAEFHRLKRGFVPTYDRWGRPIRLDADLERDFPGRGRGRPTTGREDGPGKGPAKAAPRRDAGPGPEARGDDARPDKPDKGARGQGGHGKDGGKGGKGGGPKNGKGGGKG